MHNIKKIIPRIVLIVVVVVLFECGIRYMYEKYSLIAVTMSKERKAYEGSIETIYCGTSMTQHGINVEVADGLGQGTGFNCSSIIQPADGTYYLIKDYAKNNPLKTVFYSVSSEMMVREKMPSRCKALVYDQLEGTGNKLSYLFTGVGVEEIPYVTLYSVRLKDYTDVKLVKANLREKSTDNFKTGKAWVKSYQGRGSFARNQIFDGKMDETLVKGESTFEPDKVTKKYEDALKKMIQYTKDNDIEFIMLYTPLPRDTVDGYGDYSVIHDYFAKIAEEGQVEFWDYNYYKELETIYTNELFEDEKHLNQEGGKVFTEQLIRDYKAYKNGENVEQNFLDYCPYYIE